MRRDTGFTLIELLITMLLLGFVIAGISQTFTGILSQFKQQSKIAETSIEGIVGLELLRQDIENAGFGLPWRPDTMPTYQEAVAATAYTDDLSSNDTPTNPPRAFAVYQGAGWNGSDVLIIKATNVARNDTAQKWTYIDTANVARTWDVTTENLGDSDHIIIIDPGTTDGNRRTLVTASTATADWRTTFGARSDYVPSSGYYLVYGIANSTTTALRMPFNRADYYITNPASTSTRPDRCAPNASVFSKNVISHANGGRNDNLPLLDCVADVQVVFNLDRNGDGTAGDYAEPLTDVTAVALTAEQIRNQVKEVRVYILAHEGQMDKSYTHPVTNILVGEAGIGGRTFDIGANVNYRWKVYTLVVKPANLK